MPSLGRVLIVDDEPRVAAMLHDVVVDLGYAAHMAADGPAALRVVPLYHPTSCSSTSRCPTCRGPSCWSASKKWTPACPSSS
jgi:DNA-binding NtrC family response regulator